MAKKKKLPATPLTRSQLLEHIQDLVTDYQNTTGAILDSYRDELLTESERKQFDGMVTELGAADVTLDKAISDLSCDHDMDSIINELNVLQDSNDLQTARLLPFIEDTDLELHITSKGYAYVKCQTAAQRDALEHFVTTELYPLYADSQNYLII